VPGNGIPAGTPSFVDYLKARLQDAEIVVLLLSENFFRASIVSVNWRDLDARQAVFSAGRSTPLKE